MLVRCTVSFKLRSVYWDKLSSFHLASLGYICHCPAHKTHRHITNVLSQCLVFFSCETFLLMKHNMRIVLIVSIDQE